MHAPAGALAVVAAHGVGAGRADARYGADTVGDIAVDGLDVAHRHGEEEVAAARRALDADRLGILRQLRHDGVAVSGDAVDLYVSEDGVPVRGVGVAGRPGETALREAMPACRERRRVDADRGMQLRP